jgi:hypothetical protein
MPNSKGSNNKYTLDHNPIFSSKTSLPPATYNNIELLLPVSATSVVIIGEQNTERQIERCYVAGRL